MRKHSLRKRRERLAPIALKGIAVLFVSGNPHCQLINVKTGHPIPCTPELDDLLRHTPLQWSCLMGVFCRDQNGLEYAKFAETVAPIRCYRDQVAHSLNDHHIALAKGCNPLHIVAYGWLATVTGKVVSEQDGNRIFKKYNPWKQGEQAA